MFQKHLLDCQNDVFSELLHSHPWTDLSPDRKAAMLVSPKPDSIPIVRTTCPTVACWVFQSVHLRLMQAVDIASCRSHSFNNAMAEVYGPGYTKMRYHTDCALDLENDSRICIFSCYEEKGDHPRKLVIRDKVNGEVQEILMDHLSVIVFDVRANSRHVHKIVSDGSRTRGRWLGLTMRTSKTFVTGQPHGLVFRNDGLTMTAATEDEKRWFFELKKFENKSPDFKYPDIRFSLADFRPPVTVA